tara:strand:+ start:2410 stop:3354 length:945 start_codon:yes stop_codon:yes gene_type:complete
MWRNMANFNIKKEAEVYLYDTANSAYHRLDVTEDLSFSQTFTDKTYPQKTLHEQYKLHEASNIKKANPANFEMTIPMITQSTLNVVFNLLVNFKSGEYTLNTFDLYIKLPNDVYKLEKCVITNGTFIIEKLENLKLSISGEASKLTRGATLPSTPSRGTRDYQMLKALTVKINNVDFSTCMYKVSVELQNDIKWNPYETVNKALSIGNTHDVNTTMYPSNFTLEKRILAGSLGRYVTDTSNADVQTWKIGVPIEITAGNGLASPNFRGFHLKLTNGSFTNRNITEDIFTQNYEWKMNDNSVDLGTIIKLNALIT